MLLLSQFPEAAHQRDCRKISNVNTLHSLWNSPSQGYQPSMVRPQCACIPFWNSPSQGYQPSMVRPQCACIPFEIALLRATSLPVMPQCACIPFETALLRATSLPQWYPSVPAFPLKQPFLGPPAFHGEAPVCLHSLWNSPSHGYQPSTVMPQCACIPFETALLRATSLPWWGPSVPAFPLKQPFSGLPAFHGEAPVCLHSLWNSPFSGPTSLPWWGPSVLAFPLKQPFSGLPAEWTAKPVWAPHAVITLFAEGEVKVTCYQYMVHWIDKLKQYRFQKCIAVYVKTKCERPYKLLNCKKLQVFHAMVTLFAKDQVKVSSGSHVISTKFHCTDKLNLYRF